MVNHAFRGDPQRYNNVGKFHVKTYFGMKDHRQGIVHVIGPEQGAMLPDIHPGGYRAIK